MEEKLEKEISHVEQKLVLELDQLVSDQQATLQVSLILYTTFVSCKENKIDLLLCKYNLRSSGSILLSMQAVRSKMLGDRAFMVAAPTLCNSLPKELCAI